jgi:hypothetical protein
MNETLRLSHVHFVIVLTTDDWRKGRHKDSLPVVIPAARLSFVKKLLEGDVGAAISYPQLGVLLPQYVLHHDLV